MISRPLQDRFARALQVLFFAACAGLLAVPGLIAIGEGVGERIWPEIGASRVATLDAPPPPLLPLPSNIASGAFQASVERWANAAAGFRRRFIRFHNQLMWRVFAVPPRTVDAVVVGRNQQLYEAHYVDEYCTGMTQRTFDASPSERVDRMIAIISALRDEFQRRDKPFAVLISPTKPAIYPEDIPPERCTHEAKGRLHHQMVHRLQGIGVPFIDGTQSTLAEKARNDVPVFNRYGTHWNLVGAFPSARDLAALLAKIAGRPAPVLDMKEIALSGAPVANSNDIALMMGLETYLIDGKTPHPRFTTTGDAIRNWRVAFVGSSFIEQLWQVYQRAQTFARMTYYFATIDRFFQFPEMSAQVTRRRDTWQWENVFAADAIVVEFNASFVEPKSDRMLEEMLAALNNTVQPRTR